MTIKEMEQGYKHSRAAIREFYDAAHEVMESLGSYEGSECTFAPLAQKFAKCAKRMEALGQKYGADMVCAAEEWGVDGWVKELVLREAKEAESDD